MSDRNGYNTSAQNFDLVIKKQGKILKKLEEIKIKITDLKQAKKELLSLIHDMRDEIVNGLVLFVLFRCQMISIAMRI